MSTYETKTQETFDSARQERGATECFTVVAADGVRDADGEAHFAVSSASGEMYAVSRDATGKLTCSCPDAEYNLPDGDESRCKHCWRVAYVTGMEPVPADARDDLDAVLRDRVAASEWGARYAAPDETADGESVTVATDGGRDRVVPDEQSAPDVGGLTPGERALVSIRRDRTGRGRPDDCQCWDADQSLPCWACARDGFDAPNPETPAAE